MCQRAGSAAEGYFFALARAFGLAAALGRAGLFAARAARLVMGKSQQMSSWASTHPQTSSTITENPQSSHVSTSPLAAGCGGAISVTS
jgi:hypothetical protein